MEKMKTFDPKTLETPVLHRVLLGCVGPRPIALASTIDAEGRPNLSPFSFFNVFSANPPILIFSPARRVRNNTTKHTLENVLEVPEVVINVVSHEMVQQVSLSSTEYGQGINEFIKAGLTEIPSELVRPFRVMESPAQFECTVNQVLPLGQEGGAGNLVICEVVKIHLHQGILDPHGGIDPHRIDLVARMGGNWYSRATDGLFEVAKPLSTLGIGVDKIPASIRNSGYFTGNELGILGNIEQIPTPGQVEDFVKGHQHIRSLISSDDVGLMVAQTKKYLEAGAVENAWKTLLSTSEFKLQ